MTRALSWLLRQGLRRGVFGGERKWLVLGGTALLAQLALRSLRTKPRLVFSEKLRPGERLVITHAQRASHNGLRESPAAQPEA
jgi:hypothetical protein